ncbi:MAG: sensor histidine kinase, partial [Alphaproteobacteria bacterium]
KKEFISTISHELRTPLTAIRGAIGLLRGGVAGTMSKEATQLLSISDANTERLLILVNDLLDIDRIESGELSFEMAPLAIRPFLEEVLRITETYATQHQVKLQLQAGKRDAMVRANRDRLMQIMFNLISNAVKFSPEGGSVEVDFVISPDMVTICVRDHGPGIAEEFQPRIFERFTQGDASDTRKVGGTGLGLSISRALVHRHGGRIWFETGADGTRFFVSLPRID